MNKYFQKHNKMKKREKTKKYEKYTEKTIKIRKNANKIQLDTMKCITINYVKTKSVAVLLLPSFYFLPFRLEPVE